MCAVTRRFCFLKASGIHLVIVHYLLVSQYPFSNHLQHGGTQRKQRECPSHTLHPLHALSLNNNTIIQQQIPWISFYYA